MADMNRPLYRRALLQQAACGFGSIALTGLLGGQSFSKSSLLAEETRERNAGPLAPKRAPAQHATPELTGPPLVREDLTSGVVFAASNLLNAHAHPRVFPSGRTGLPLSTPSLHEGPPSPSLPRARPL